MLDAQYFDGKSARLLRVTLLGMNGVLRVRGEGMVRDEPWSALRIGAKLGNTPRTIYFPDGAHCEIDNHEAFEALLKLSGKATQTWLSRLENRWHPALLSTLISALIFIAAYHWGLPWAAQLAAEKIPSSVASRMDAGFLDGLDGDIMQASVLTQARQKQLRAKFARLASAGNVTTNILEFRSSKAIGANAFALPGGTVIITDQLIALASSDEEILAVLAHELGHVSERHSLRQLLQGSVIGLVMTWYLGDVSSLIVAAPTLLLETGYSRDFERNADHYAASLLRNNHIASSRLADMLEKLEASHHSIQTGMDGSSGDQAQSSRIDKLFSTHPDTAERIRELRRIP